MRVCVIRTCRLMSLLSSWSLALYEPQATAGPAVASRLARSGPDPPGVLAAVGTRPAAFGRGVSFERTRPRRRRWGCLPLTVSGMAIS